MDSKYTMDNSEHYNQISILCCLCGILITPNPSNTCAQCLSYNADITRGICTEVTLHQCRGCQRWHQEGSKWITCELESRELMSLCLRNINGLKLKSSGKDRVRLVDATWIWTEPHSMRLKIRLTVQKEVYSSTILQQSFVVFFFVRNQQCIECQSIFRHGNWRSLVQVRQRVGHKRTFLYLEQLILKNEAHRGCTKVQIFRDGMDFYFPDKANSSRFISFLEHTVPVKVKLSKKLISKDVKSNISNFKYTNLVEICPLCKDDLLFLQKRMARNMGNISRLVLVKNVTNVIHLIDPQSGQTAQMSPEAFWRNPIIPIVTAKRSRFTRYVVLRREAIIISRNVSRKATTKCNQRKLASLTISKDSDLGLNDASHIVTSHIGYLLKAGDIALGYDLRDMQLVNPEAEKSLKDSSLPDIVILRKLYGGLVTQDLDSTVKRIFCLRKLDRDVTVEYDKTNKRKTKNDHSSGDSDYEDFLREVETDKEMRDNINIYRSKILYNKDVCTQPFIDTENIEEDEDDQKLTIDELLDGLDIETSPKKEECFPKVIISSKDGPLPIDRRQSCILAKKNVPVSVGNTLSEEFRA